MVILLMCCHFYDRSFFFFNLFYSVVHRLFTVKADSTFTLALSIFLIVKYAFFDDNSMEYELLMSSTTRENKEPTATAPAVHSSKVQLQNGTCTFYCIKFKENSFILILLLRLPGG